MLRQRLHDFTEVLQAEAGKEPLVDRYSCGYIAAIKDFLDVQLDEELE